MCSPQSTARGQVLGRAEQRHDNLCVSSDFSVDLEISAEAVQQHLELVL